MTAAPKCPVCQNSGVSGWVDPRYNYCNVCKLGWLKKTPPNTNYSQNYYKGASLLGSMLFKPIFSLLYHLRGAYIENAKVNLWIDIGAGDGDFLMTTGGRRKIGVEVSDFARLIMEEKGLEVLSDKQFLATKNLKADVVSFWHVLEHLKDPKKYLQSAKKNLKKEGILIIAVPNIDSFEFKLFKDNWFHLDPNRHLWHFSPKSLEILLRSCGLKILNIDYFSPEYNIAGILQSFINLSTNKKNLLHRVIKRKNKGKTKIGFKEVLLLSFWLTFGLTIVVLFWIISALCKKSGAIVMVILPHNPNSEFIPQKTKG